MFPFHRITSGLCLVMAGILFAGCSALNLVPDDKVLYTGADIKLIPSGRITAKKKIKQLLNSNINPKPNKSIFGMRPNLWVYYKVKGNPKKGLKKFLKNKIGEAPVYITDIDPDKTKNLLKGHLINNGYFQSEVKFDVTVKGKKGKVLYTAYVHQPYRLRNIATPTIDTLFTNIDSLKRDSYLKARQRYNLERLEAEQARIEEALENLGFYFFDDRHLIFEADSTVGDHQVDLTLALEPGVPAKAKRIYTVNHVNVFPEYTLSLDTVTRPADTTKVEGINYIDRQKNYKPWIITKVVNLAPGKRYSTLDRENTLSHLMSLGSFKFVNIKFTESKVDSSSLDANIYLTPHLKKSLRAEFQATSKSNNFVGPGLMLSFTNRNFLRGSERFEIRVNSSYEVQVSRKIPNPLNAFEVGIESSLSVPRFITPFKIYYPNRRYLPSTDIKAGFRVQNRVGFFRLNSLNTSFGYTWRENTLKTHEFYPIDINFLRLGKSSDDFQEILKKNPFLARSFEDQFIMGARYSYTLNTQINRQRAKKFLEEEFEKHHFYFNGSVDISGNIIHALQGGGFKQDINAEQEKIFGKVYSQFARTEVDFRHYWQLNKTNMLASRIAGGVGYAYGNSITMPYIKQFSVGGSNSIRAFPARTIGPGTYYVREDEAAVSDNRITFIDQRGDVRLEGTTEYRKDITNTIKGAVFIDAGNIWLLREDSTRTGGKFERSQFLKQLAVGTGVGVRFDFNFFILRFDLAFPLRKPWRKQDEENPWVFDEIDFGSSRWRSENLILNIAIGYPF
jgi:outer membrane protein insertion porin family